ncbi:MAG: DUF4271 domain-containing protein [Chitinophagaceae bacterium]
MKICLTILLFLIAGNIFSQTDTALQRMIDEAKSKAAQQKKDSGPVKKIVKPVKKDTALFTDSFVKKTIPPVLKDSTEPVSSDSSLQKFSDTSVSKNQTVTLAADTSKYLIIPWLHDTAFTRLLYLPGLLSASKMPLHDSVKRNPESKDYLFYLFAGLLLFLGIINRSFPGYIKGVFNLLFFQSHRYKQSREKTMQDTVPSLLLNILFFIVAGLWITFLMENIPLFHFTFMQKIVAAITLVAFIYAIKAILISISGSLFHKREGANAYATIVFHINKIAGIILLPLAILYAYGSVYQKSLAVSFLIALILLLFIYRFVISIVDMTGRFKINGLYFFIYLCVTEIIPMIIFFEIVPGIIAKYGFT